MKTSTLTLMFASGIACAASAATLLGSSNEPKAEGIVVVPGQVDSTTQSAPTLATTSASTASWPLSAMDFTSADPTFGPAYAACAETGRPNNVPLKPVDAAGDHGVENLAILRTAIDQAKRDLAAAPDTTRILKIGAGEYVIGAKGSGGVVLNGLNRDATTSTGWLVLRGSGRLKTALEFGDDNERAFHAAGIRRFALCNIHISRTSEEISQGTVRGFLTGVKWNENSTLPGNQTLVPDGSGNPVELVSTPTPFVAMEVMPGYPRPGSIYYAEIYNASGRWLNGYGFHKPDTSGAGLHREPFSRMEQQVGWTNFADSYPVNGTDLTILGAHANYGILKAGSTMAIKSKKFGDVLFTAGARQIVIMNSLFTRASRMKFRDTSQIRVVDLMIRPREDPSRADPFLATSSGGPQIGQDGDSELPEDVMVTQSYFDRLGDDHVGLFQSKQGRRIAIVGNTMKDNFARAIFASPDTTHVCYYANLIDRNLVLSHTGYANDCVNDTTAPSAPTPVNTILSPRKIRLRWTPSQDFDADGVTVTRTGGGRTILLATGVTGIQYDDISVEPGTSYTYEVRTIDRSRNVSSPITFSATAQ